MELARIARERDPIFPITTAGVRFQNDFVESGNGFARRGKGLLAAHPRPRKREIDWFYVAENDGRRGRRLSSLALPARFPGGTIAEFSRYSAPAKKPGFVEEELMKFRLIAAAGLVAAFDRGREGFWPPLPPNRTCGFPAYGSPVAGFLIGNVSRAQALL
jgi:hypothetical protein